MDGLERFGAFEFQKQGSIHHDIHPISTVDLISPILNFKGNLSREREALDRQLPAKAGLVGGLQQPGAKMPVYLDGTTNDFRNQIIL